MRGGWRRTLVKFSIFAVVMIALTASLFFIFGQYRTGSTNGYSAVFTDVSRLKPGRTVRMAGIRVGTVSEASLRDDKKVVVKFDADRSVALTSGTRAMVRYLNLVGDRYLELADGLGDDQDLTGGLTDSRRPDSGCTRPRSAARWTQAGDPGVESARRQLAQPVADADISRARAARWSRCCRRRRRSRMRWPTTIDSIQQLIDNLNTIVGHAVQERRQVQGHTGSAPATRQRTVAGPRSDRRRNRPAGQRNRLDRRPADQRATAAGGHRRRAESAGSAARRRQGHSGRQHPENAG